MFFLFCSTVIIDLWRKKKEFLLIILCSFLFSSGNSEIHAWASCFVANRQPVVETYRSSVFLLVCRTQAEQKLLQSCGSDVTVVFPVDSYETRSVHPHETFAVISSGQHTDNSFSDYLLKKKVELEQSAAWKMPIKKHVLSSIVTIFESLRLWFVSFTRYSTLQQQRRVGFIVFDNELDVIWKKQITDDLFRWGLMEEHY